MDIEEYRQKFDVSYSVLAERCNCGISTLANIASGRANPSFDLAIRIEKATDHLVSHENWYPIPFIYRDTSIIVGSVSI